MKNLSSDTPARFDLSFTVLFIFINSLLYKKSGCLIIRRRIFFARKKIARPSDRTAPLNL
ncbi:MAG: hypothetical protein A2008_13225 [Candidatus Wallbacteria bacterium GWC2_49_35]|uniref:Uncharacterized protein n=1 Tax=Candidatus Wallbacteria bacterium GWC2_49_35 TaxID=1817813 RepID=A0A1F7WY67_9BACT|nr:MAG: hypothetical protein A2008_13225 [Candidatus Wallbacteria bacterium GWC2_49_35]HBC75442.1 hypothetical protein [Candidatus Wallbacteria bacterium]